MEIDGEWLHEIAIHNKVLEKLHLCWSNFTKIKVQDLELVGSNCLSLSSLHITCFDISELVGVFNTATKVEEFGGVCVKARHEQYLHGFVALPHQLRTFSIFFAGRYMMDVIFPIAFMLEGLNLILGSLNSQNHCNLLENCPNLQSLQTSALIGDQGLHVVGQTCKRLKKLTICLEQQDPGITQVGLIALAEGCLELEYLSIGVSDITNGALEHVGTFSKNLCVFRLTLLDTEEFITDLPLDRGVRALLMGCDKLGRFALSLRPGGLTDVGLGYIGQYSQNVRWMRLGRVGESDAGLLQFSTGCPKLKKLEMRGCPFSGHALAVAVTQLQSLKYFWIEGYRGSRTGLELMPMARLYWNIEFFPGIQVSVLGEHEDDAVFDRSQIFGHLAVAGQQRDETVKLFV